MNVLDHLLSILFFCQKAAATSVVHVCQKIRAQVSLNNAKLLVYLSATNMYIPHIGTISVPSLPHIYISYNR